MIEEWAVFVTALAVTGSPVASGAGLELAGLCGSSHRAKPQINKESLPLGVKLIPLHEKSGIHVFINAINSLYSNINAITIFI